MTNIMSEIDNIKEKREKELNPAQNPEELAEHVLDDQPIYYDREKNWFMFHKTEKRWIKVDEVDILTYIKKKYKVFNLSTSFIRTNLINALKDEGRFRIPDEIDDYKIQIGRYLFDIRNDDVFEMEEHLMSKIVIPHNILGVGKDEECPNIDKLFEDWVGERKEVLYDIIAYCMSPKHFLDICFWFIGNGENGKGLFQTILNNVIGYKNITSQDLELLSNPQDRFTKAFLHNKLICSLGDGNYSTLNHTKSLKTLSGCSDLVRGEIKGGTQFDFHNRAKLVGAFNTLPETKDKTMGFYRRQHITEFKNDFSGMKNPLPDIPEREYTVLAKKCWDRLKEIYRTNEIKGWGTKEERKELYEKLSNPIGLFIKEACEEDYDSFVFPKVLHSYYSQWAVKNGYNQFRQDEFEARLSNQGWELKRKDVYIYGKDCWGKKNKIPQDVLEELRKDNQGFDPNSEKRNVWFYIKVNLDKKDKIDKVLEMEPLYKDSNLKNVSILSKTSILDSIGNEGVKIQDLIDRFGKEAETLIKELCETGELFEPQRGTIRKL